MKTKIIVAALLALLLQSYSSCKNSSENKVLTKEITFTKEGTLTITRSVNDSIIAHLDIEFAESDYETQTGLMYRKQMQSNQGMLFIFPREEMKSFYMKNTEFSLDIIYLDKNLKVIDIIKNAKPYDITALPSSEPAQYVLEVNGGLSDQWGLTEGDVISYGRE